MKKIILVFLLLLLVVGSFVGWYLLRPVFVDDVVNETLPFDVSQIEQETQNEENLVVNQENLSDSNDLTIENSSNPAQEIEQEAQTQEVEPEVEEEIKPQLLFSGSFTGANNYDVEGDANIIEFDDSLFVNFENFKADNGPDLFVYLSTDDTNNDFINLGELKGNIGNQNYEVDSNVDLDKYDTVLIWCKRFEVSFGAAPLE